MPATHPNSHRLRKGRFSAGNHVYHITTATKNRRPFFANFHVGRHVVHALHHEATHNRIHTLAFVVMPDHLHWLLQLTESRSLAGTVNNVKSISARMINNFLGRSGPVWQKGYYDRALRSDEDMVSVARYIIANPVRAGIVARVGDYALWDSGWV